MVMMAYYAKDMGDIFKDDEDEQPGEGIEIRNKPRNRHHHGDGDDLDKLKTPLGLRASLDDVAWIDDPLGDDPRLSMVSDRSKSVGYPEAKESDL